MSLRLGIDVGGTHTDAVVLDGSQRLLAQAKVATTSDVSSGIAAAIDAVLTSDAVDSTRIGHVMLGTTQAANAVLERRKLQRVAVIRIGGPATGGIPPLATWPADLREIVSAGEMIAAGGIEYDGREIAPFDDAPVGHFLESLQGTVDSVAITSVFAPVSNRHELAAARIVKDVLGDVHLSLSHEIGTIGLLERENATVLNAALAGIIRDVAGALGRTLDKHGLAPSVFFAQNDGTLMALDYALQFPVLTIASGPANSIRGAAYLTGVTDAVVVDAGGTSTDVGMLTNGFLRESSTAHLIGGVTTNCRMPDLVSITVGGGSIIDDTEHVTIGPKSVGYRLTDEAIVFGGSTQTVTDAAVAAGRSALGDPRRVAPLRQRLSLALAEVDARVAAAVDEVKLTRGSHDLVVVGGAGSLIVPDTIPGVREIIRPAHHDVANAIGASIAPVGGQDDRVVDLQRGNREEATGAAYDAAVNRAVRAGADPQHIELVEIDEVPLAYLTHPAARIRIKVAGPLGAI